MPTFLIEGDCTGILSRLFSSNGNGLWFGHFGCASISSAEVDDLLVGAIRFRDYICEGFLVYGVRAENRNPGCLLTVKGEGSNRDQYIRSAVRHYITNKKLVIASESA